MVWCAFILETAVLGRIAVLSTIPNLLLIVTVCTGFILGKKDGIMTGFLAGLTADIAFGSVFGLYALLYLIIGYLAGCFTDVFFSDAVRVPLIMVTAADLIYGLVVYAAGFLLRGRTDFPAFLRAVILPEATFTAIFLIIFYKLIYRILRSAGSYERKGSQSLWIKE